MQKLLEEIIVNIVQAREAHLQVLRIKPQDVKPDITKDELRQIIRTLREYNYNAKMVKMELIIYPMK